VVLHHARLAERVEEDVSAAVDERDARPQRLGRSAELRLPRGVERVGVRRDPRAHERREVVELPDLFGMNRVLIRPVHRRGADGDDHRHDQRKRQQQSQEERARRHTFSIRRVGVGSVGVSE
jgi:hypothetical protein